MNEKYLNLEPIGWYIIFASTLFLIILAVIRNKYFNDYKRKKK